MKFLVKLPRVSLTRAASRAVFASAALTLLSGCGDDLDRDSAAQLITTTAAPEGIHHDFGRAVFQCLLDNGYLNANIMGASLTPEGQPLFRSMEFSSYRGESGFALTQPMMFKDVKVTGITDMTGQGSDAPKRIEFSASYTFPGIPPESAAFQCMSQAPQSITGTVVTQKYDDGWRITSWEIPQFK